MPVVSRFLTVTSLASGMALLVSIFGNVSLALTLGLLGSIAASIIGLKWFLSSVNTQRVLKAQIVTGLIAGCAATAAYDLSRLVIVSLPGVDYFPFETFSIFGRLILGLEVPRTTAFLVGALYHLLNGIMFSIAYCFLLGGRHWAFGIVWGLGLEAIMVTIYPGWLDLEAVMAEFLTVSILGHIAYGVTLGVISRVRLNPFRLSRIWLNPLADPGTLQER